MKWADSPEARPNLSRTVVPCTVRVRLLGGVVTTSPVETPSADTRGAGQLADNPAAKHSQSTMATAMPRAEVETEATLAVPATSVKPRRGGY